MNHIVPEKGEALLHSLTRMQKSHAASKCTCRLLRGENFRDVFTPAVWLERGLQLNGAHCLSQDYQAIVDAEWNILYDKLDKLHQSGAKVVLSKLPIGDVATQYFADRDMFCAGRVPEEDLKRTMMVMSCSSWLTCLDMCAPPPPPLLQVI